MAGAERLRRPPLPRGPVPHPTQSTTPTTGAPVTTTSFPPRYSLRGHRGLAAHSASSTARGSLGFSHWRQPAAFSGWLQARPAGVTARQRSTARWSVEVGTKRGSPHEGHLA